MRHPIEGTPFVPPNPICPAEQIGNIPNLDEVDFELYVFTSPTHLRITEIRGAFGGVWNEEGEYVRVVSTPFVEVPIDSPLANEVYRLAEDLTDAQTNARSTAISNTESEPVEQIRQQLCERVANCQGVVNGECWALGRTAMKEILEEVLQMPESTE